MTLKDSFLEAVAAGKLGVTDDFGTVVTLQEFKRYFKNIETGYITSFMPASVIETGQYSATHTRFLFRIKKGVYRVHPEAIEEYCLKHDKLNNHTAVYSATEKQIKSFRLNGSLM
ncbi:MAG: hypothetical protein OQL06_13240 [Gammaproteobacteria bacterium]|nr:hypothetical protein [Gammaproteobacteria bacterium]